MLVITDKGAESFLRARLNNAFPAGGGYTTLKLFVNNRTPTDADSVGAYTEATGGGYVTKTLTSGSWTVTNGAALSQATYALQTFTFTGPLTNNPSVYGYFIVDADNVLVLAELFDAPVTPVVNGNYISLVPTITASKGTPA